MNRITRTASCTRYSRHFCPYFSLRWGNTDHVTFELLQITFIIAFLINVPRSALLLIYSIWRIRDNGNVDWSARSHGGHIPKTCGSTSHCGLNQNWQAANKDHGNLYWKWTFQLSYGPYVSYDPGSVIYLWQYKNILEYSCWVNLNL